jgi:hypothetical protein
MMEKLTGEVAGIAPSSGAGGQISGSYEKTSRLAYLFMYFYRLRLQRRMITVKLT